MDLKNIVSLNPVNNLWIKILIVLTLSFSLVIFVFKLHLIGEVDQDTSLEDFTAYLDERIPFLMEKYDIPGVNVALVKNAAIPWSKAYGYAHLETGRKMTVNTCCRVESISKSVTAWGVMKLVEQGRIGLDDPVEQHLGGWTFPKSKYAKEKVTIRQLLSHNAGLPLGTVGVRYSPKKAVPGLEESLSKEVRLIREPGTAFSYSNTGFNLLELLIEKVTGRDFAEYMKAEVLLPLGMRDSIFTWSAELIPAVPFGYDLKANPIPVYIYPEKASGGLFATVEDIATFITAGMSDFSDTARLTLTSDSINQLYTPMIEKPGFYSLAFDSYGLGHFIETFPNGIRGVSHGGQGSGWMTHFHSVPETGDGIVIIANSQRSWPFFAYLLRDWAKWNGFSSIGMGKIIWGEKIVGALIGLILFVVSWQGYRLGQGLISGKRRFGPLAKQSRRLRLIQSGLSVILLSVLWWCVNQEYLFITSVFPTISGKLGLSILLLALVLSLSALFPLYFKPLLSKLN